MENTMIPACAMLNVLSSARILRDNLERGLALAGAPALLEALMAPVSLGAAWRRPLMSSGRGDLRASMTTISPAIFLQAATRASRAPST
jgi:hypothetical protein